MNKHIITTRVNNPSECFSISLVENDYPFNIRFSTKSTFKKDETLFGPGIYSIFDKIANKLVYVGLHTPNKSAVEERYFKHIQNLTLRGTRVCFRMKAIKCDNAQLNYLLSLLSNEKLALAINDCDSMVVGKCRLREGGFVASENKIQYVDSQWEDIGSWDSIEKIIEGLDNRYHFQFDKIVNFFDVNLSSHNLQVQLKKKFEDVVIERFNPLANGDYVNNLSTLKYKNDDGELGPQIISKLIFDIVRPSNGIENDAKVKSMSKEDLLKSRLVALVEEINAQGSDYKVKFNQQKVNTYNMSISGANGRMYINPLSDGYDVSLLGESLVEVVYAKIQELFGKPHCGYKHKGKEYQPYWRTDNFELVKQAVYIYAKTTK